MRLLLGLLSLLLASAPVGFAYSLLGPYDTWQTTDLGYDVNEANPEIGGPMNKDEGYRWNVQVITYGFDPTFVKFFGKKGVDEVNKAIAVYNALPRFSKMSSNLSEYPLNTLRRNYRAQSLGLIDLKSTVMGVLTEELGLANPHTFVWTLRDKVQITGGFSYQVIMRNFDPATGQYSRYINGVLYSYRVLDPVPGFNTAFADAVDFPLDPFAPTASSVAGFSSQYAENSTVGFVGGFFTGLTRDDVGGLRYLYSSKNRAMEGLPPNTVAAGGSGAWSPVPVAGTNTVVDVALRPGVDRIVLRQLKFDAGGLGGFTPVTNRMTDVYIDARNRQMKQTIGRALALPDIVFSAADMNRNLLSRTDTGNWVNYATTNSPGGGGDIITGGPGIIVSPITITFNKIGPSLINQYSANSFFLDEGDGSQDVLWGAFDGSTNTPFIFPVDNYGNSYPIEELEQSVFGGAF